LPDPKTQEDKNEYARRVEQTEEPKRAEPKEDTKKRGRKPKRST